MYRIPGYRISIILHAVPAAAGGRR
eukprot:SAG31_NODE_17197_length_679_cov_1.256897_2_plen_24_part_01